LPRFSSFAPFLLRRKRPPPLPPRLRPGPSLSLDPFALVSERVADPVSEKQFEAVQELVVVARNAKAVPHKSLKPSGWAFNDSRVEDLLGNIRHNSVPLSDYVGTAPLYGLKTGLNEAFYLEDSVARRIMAEEPQSKDIIKPFIRGRDIKRWNVSWENQWHIAIASSQNREYARPASRLSE